MAHKQIALQLYSVREQMARNFSGTLRAVADMGFTDVETAFLPEGMSLTDAAAQLRAHGLKPIAMHVDLPLGEARDGVLRAVDAYGSRRIIWHGWPRDERHGSLAGLRSLADDYNSANEWAAAHGLELGLHNHWWENEAVDGVVPYQYMLANVAPAVFFELDAYWATVAGRDPVAIAGDMGARLKMLHLKDGPATRNAPMQALGTGVMQIPALLAATDFVSHVVIELDECATDMLAALAASRNYLTALA